MAVLGWWTHGFPDGNETGRHRGSQSPRRPLAGRGPTSMQPAHPVPLHQRQVKPPPSSLRTSKPVRRVRKRQGRRRRKGWAGLAPSERLPGPCRGRAEQSHTGRLRGCRAGLPFPSAALRLPQFPVGSGVPRHSWGVCDTDACPGGCAAHEGCPESSAAVGAFRITGWALSGQPSCTAPSPQGTRAASRLGLGLLSRSGRVAH